MRRETTDLVTLPNLLTLLRVVLVAPFTWFAMRGQDSAALGVVFVAGITDALDGELARLLGQESKWGRLLDPLADKLLTAIAFTVLSLFRGPFSAIPLWLTAAVIIRDLFILGGSGFVYARVGSSDFRPTLFGKLNTVLEIGVMLAFLGAAPFLKPLYWLVFTSILVSGADYALQGVRMLRRVNL